MAQTLITTDLLLKETLMQLKNHLILAAMVNVQYKDEFAKIGENVKVRRPVMFTAEDGPTLQNQDIEEGSVEITINYDKHVSFKIPTRDLTLTVEKISERYIKPAAAALAQAVESSISGLYVDVWNVVGTPGTTPHDLEDLSAASLIMDNGAVPEDTRAVVVNPTAGWSLASGLKGVYVNEKAKKAIERGRLGDYAGFSTHKCQSIKPHTVGTHGGTPLVKGANQASTYTASKDTNAQTLITDGWTASAAILRKGDVFTIADVYAVNPATKDSTEQLQGFVVNADVTADGSGNATISISPAIIVDGAYQTVDAAPSDNKAITVVTGTAGSKYPQNLAFHKDAFALVTVPLEKPESANGSRLTEDGFSLLLTKDYDITNRTEIYRIDMMWGTKTIRPELAVRVTG